MSDGHILIFKKRASFAVDKNVAVGIKSILIDTLGRAIIVLAF